MNLLKLNRDKTYKIKTIQGLDFSEFLYITCRIFAYMNSFTY